MTLHPIPSEFPYTVYEENLIFFFYQWAAVKANASKSSLLNLIPRENVINAVLGSIGFAINKNPFVIKKYSYSVSNITPQKMRIAKG